MSCVRPIKCERIAIIKLIKNVHSIVYTYWDDLPTDPICGNQAYSERFSSCCSKRTKSHGSIVSSMRSTCQKLFEAKRKSRVTWRQLRQRDLHPPNFVGTRRDASSGSSPLIVAAAGEPPSSFSIATTSKSHVAYPRYVPTARSSGELHKCHPRALS